MEFLSFGKSHESQRGYFAASLYEAMVANKDVWLVVADLGYGVFDKHFRDFPDRTLNTGASEQAAAGICVGLALEGKSPFFYTISSFLARCIETIHLYSSHEQIPVVWVGSGRDNDYTHDGISHAGQFAQATIGLLNMDQYYPQNKEEVPGMVSEILENRKPSFLSLTR